MHRLIENHLEEALALSDLPEDHAVRQHLNDCGECRVEVDAMREHSELLRGWRAPAEMDPRPGFYARVWDRNRWSCIPEFDRGRRRSGRRSSGEYQTPPRPLRDQMPPAWKVSCFRDSRVRGGAGARLYRCCFRWECRSAVPHRGGRARLEGPTSAKKTGWCCSGR